MLAVVAIVVGLRMAPDHFAHAGSELLVPFFEGALAGFDRPSALGHNRV